MGFNITKMFHIKDANNKINNRKLEYIFAIESPKRSIISDKKVIISGWIIPVGSNEIISLRSKNNNTYRDVQYGIERFDVAKSKSHLDKNKSLHSGFYLEQEYEDGLLTIEVDAGNGYQPIYEINLRYSPEPLFDSVYNKDLASNFAEHQITLDNKRAYFYEGEYNNRYERGEYDPKLIAFYLPQFHPIEQNDKAWGKGFTEWTNVTSGQSRFIGHQQPILPGGLGFYDLRIEDNIFKQIELAKKYGIYGFCFYYYWFSGAKILDGPINSFLNHKEWDFNFMICWANENWTRRWDGRDKDVIIAQKYLDDDPLRFIKDVEHILLDKRYIHKDGKPILIVYRGSELKKPEAYIKCWRDYFKNTHNQELEILSMMNFDATDPREYGFDAGVEFAPLTDYRMKDFDKTKSKVNNLNERMLDLNFTGSVVDYRAFINRDYKSRKFNFPTYKCLSPSWDNEARKKGKGSLTMYGSNPDLYAAWLDSIIKNETNNKEESSPVIFVNAWNEWAEGAVLEPTAHNGYSILNRTVEVLSQHSSQLSNLKNFKLFRLNRRDNAKLAVVVHVYYEDGWDYINKKLSCLDDIEYDLFITYTKISEGWIKKISEFYPNAYIKLVPNRGRDILPFLFIVNRIKNMGYSKILKIHTKKSRHRNDGEIWFRELIDSLLPNKKVIASLMSVLEAKNPILVGPVGHYISLEKYIGSNKKEIYELIAKNNFDRSSDISIDQDSGFFAGSMFWCNINALNNVIDLNLIPEDFESERGQIDGTLAHAIERLLSSRLLLPDLDIMKMSSREISSLTNNDIINDYIFSKTEGRS